MIELKDRVINEHEIFQITRTPLTRLRYYNHPEGFKFQYIVGIQNWGTRMFYANNIKELTKRIKNFLKIRQEL